MHRGYCYLTSLGFFWVEKPDEREKEEKKNKGAAGEKEQGG